MFQVAKHGFEKGQHSSRVTVVESGRGGSGALRSEALYLEEEK